jgi:hypothetical protein
MNGFGSKYPDSGKPRGQLCFFGYIANCKESNEAYYELKLTIYQDPDLMAFLSFLGLARLQTRYNQRARYLPIFKKIDPFVSAVISMAY